MTRRTIRLEIGQIAFAGVDPGNRRRFERAFLAACDAELRDAQPRGVRQARLIFERSRNGADRHAGRTRDIADGGGHRGKR